MSESHMTRRALPLRGWCASFQCVDVKPVDGGVKLTSTIDGNDDSIFYTQDEWDQHVLEQFSGLWLHTVSADVRAQIRPLLPALRDEEAEVLATVAI